MARLAKIMVFPIKALEGIELESCALTQAGALENDRRFALKDEKSRYVNGKRHPVVNQIRAEFDLQQQTITLGVEGAAERQTFELREGNRQLESWFSGFFGFDVQLVEDDELGFPDDSQRPGPTIISTASLIEVCSWFPDLSLEEARRRFRANLELSDCPAFWEDQLNSVADQGIAFKLGGVAFEGLKHSVRCPVPTQDTKSGEVMAEFQKVFMQKRKETLPRWVNAESFNHYYRIAINTRVLHVAGELQLGDELLINKV